MKKPRSDGNKWKAEVKLIPHYVSKRKEKELLTELTQVLYDLSIQFQREEMQARRNKESKIKRNYQ